MIRVGCTGHHGRRVNRGKREVGSGEGLSNGGDGIITRNRRDFRGRHRLCWDTRFVVVVDQLGVNDLISVVKATR